MRTNQNLTNAIYKHIQYKFHEKISWEKLTIKRKKKKEYLPWVVKWPDLIWVKRHRISNFVLVIRCIRSHSRNCSAQQQQNDDVPPSSPRHFSPETRRVTYRMGVYNWVDLERHSNIKKGQTNSRERRTRTVAQISISISNLEGKMLTTSTRGLERVGCTQLTYWDTCLTDLGTVIMTTYLETLGRCVANLTPNTSTFFF